MNETTKHDGKYVAYYRVSTDKQKRSGLGLEAQKEAVAGYLNGGRWKLMAEFTERVSGKRDDRPQLAQALAMCRVQSAALIVAKLDRLARNVEFLLKIHRESGDKGTAVPLGVSFVGIIRSAGRVGSRGCLGLFEVSWARPEAYLR